MRAFALLVATLALAGCIGPSTPGARDAPDPSGSASDAGEAPPATMTAEETRQDTAGRCEEDDGGVSALPFCAERHLTVTGILTLDSLAIDLVAGNGGIVVQGVPGASWSLDAVVRVRGATEEEARKNLDTQFAWSHTDGASHFLKAGPVGPAGTLPLDLPAPTSTADASYVLRVPADVVYAVKGRWTNGGAEVHGVATTLVDLAGTNGGIALSASVVDVRAEATNGGVTATIEPTASGTVTAKATNGGVAIDVPETSRHGYDVAGSAENGGVEITLRDGQVTGDESSRKFVTDGFASRAVQTKVSASVTNGGVTVT